MTKIYFEIGKLFISISGNDTIVNVMGEQFSHCRLDEKPPIIDLQIRFIHDIRDTDFKPEYFPLSGLISFNQNTFYKKTYQYTYVIKNLFTNNMPTEVYISDQGGSCITDTIIRKMRGIDKSYWRCESYMTYAFMWMVFAITFQKKERAFIHSGIIAIDGKATVFCGTGGCGKTSTSFKLLEKENTSFLAEDFGIIDKNGIAYYNPKRVTMYASDVRYGQKDLIAYRKKMSGRDDLVWRIEDLLKRNPIRKIDPYELLGEKRIARKAKIELFVFLVREERKDTICEDIEIDDLIYRITESSYRELKELFELLSNIHALGGKETTYPAIEELKAAHSEVIRSALQNSNFCICRVNRKGSPDDILNAISKWKTKNNCSYIKEI